ncbi:MAG: calcium/sodium antiporter [Phycisphaerales bacterium]|nr:calcium/sodium antiporter [Phycisphaerales bacterium]|tara:strand:- start:8048 stop:9046 length:999 start_codon:yes stop_codon:yes gene_type:complete
MIALLDTSDDSTISWQLASVLVAVGVVGLVFGGHLLVSGAVSVAKRLGMSTLMIGLTIVALGTSAPELALNVIAAAGGETGLAFGNVIGSNIANIALVLGLTALVAPIPIPRATLKLGGIPWLILLTLIAVALPWMGDSPENSPSYQRWSGILLLCCVPLTILLWQRDQRIKDENEDVDEIPSRDLLPSVLLVLGGLVLLIAGGRSTEMGAVSLARWMGLSEAVIGLSIVAVATSLPEIVTSVVAARKGVPSLAIGTVIGSNIFNLSLVLGTTSIVSPVILPESGGMIDLFIMAGLTLCLLPLAITGRRIARPEGVLLLVVWAAAITFSIMR